MIVAAIVFALRYLGWNDTTGDGRVIDGDSLLLDGQQVRLFGIDAPELSQQCQTSTGSSYSCGRKARQYLQSIVKGNRVTCKVMNIDRYRREVSICRIGDVELNLKMLQAGWAVNFYTPSLRYLRAEKQARQQRRGLWQGQFMPPSQWREEHR